MKERYAWKSGAGPDFDRLHWLQMISSRAYGAAARAQPVAFDYQYNAANQRTRVNREDGAHWVYTYDDLGQVISGRMATGSDLYY
jgi:YD repeat-containing protein